MAWLRREKHPGLVDAFRASAEHLDRAQRALLAAVPTARDPGIPLDQALEAFAEALAVLERTIDRWHDPRIEDDWRASSSAIAQARALAKQLGQEGELGFEALNARIGDVLAPLEAFADASRAIRAL